MKKETERDPKLTCKNPKAAREGEGNRVSLSSDWTRRERARPRELTDIEQDSLSRVGENGIDNQRAECVRYRRASVDAER